MLLGGDEFRRTQHGNNNAWCQDNDTSWFDWNYLERHGEIQQFVRDMISLRVAHPALSKESFYTDSEIQWLSSAGGSPNWSEPTEKALACVIQENENSKLLVIFNAHVNIARFQLPLLPKALTWRLAVDTARPPRLGFLLGADDLPLDNSKPYSVEARSSVIFLTRNQEPDVQHS